MTLWLSLLALALGAMGFVLYPLRQRRLDDGDALRLSSNLATFEERRAELAEDLASGSFSKVVAGLWRGRAVAVKVLTDTSSAQLRACEEELLVHAALGGHAGGGSRRGGA